MNRLLGSRCYECGPIDYTNDRGRFWRDEIKPFLRELGVIVIDPCQKPIINVLKEDKDLFRKLEGYVQTEQWYKLSNIIREIRVTDLRCVDISDWVIAHIDRNITMTGTMEEIFCANRQKKPVLIHCEQTLKDIPKWLWGTLPVEFMFDDWDKLKEYIDYIDKNDNIDTMKRWVFFDYEKLLLEIGFTRLTKPNSRV
uniref:Uncharacterized protein n=1 Tax=viral metagenome TaxID=1070528 RepID=A0A6M3KWR0_9ZZZZ